MSGLLSGGRVEILGDARGVGRQIAARLTALGISAHLVAEVSAEATGVVFAQGLDAVDDGPANAVAIQRAALGAARTLARRTSGRLFVTLQDTGGDFGFSGRAGARAWIGGLAGLVKTAAAEWPEASVKAIDVDATALAVDDVAHRVVSELLLGGRDVEVALDAAGGRAVIHHRAVAYRVTPESAVSLRPGSVLIVSGGARGVTASSLIALCKDRPRLALLGRTALVEERGDTRAAKNDPELRRALLARGPASGKPISPKEVAGQSKLILDCREIRENIAALERAGAEVTYLPIDVRDAAAVRACVDSIRRAWGPIHGIIHGAGVLADALIANQTDEQFDRVFGTKVDGLRHLLDATASDPVELLLFFASVAGRFGNSAQAAYAMANQVLATVAANERVRRPACRVRALAWGPWAGGMVTPGLAKLFEKAGVKLIALDAGAKALALEAISDDGQPEVVLMNGEPPVVALPIHGGRAFTGEGRFDVWVSAATLPFLDGHRINGAAVVPAVLVMEWFFRAAKACCPTLQPLACLNVRIFRGVPVDGFDDRGVRLVVHAKVLESSASHAKVELRLLDEHAKPRYGAVVEMGDLAPALPAAPLPAAPADGVPSPWTVGQIYSEALFHRGAFAVIRSLDLVSDEGASAVLGGLRDARWCEGGTDVTWLSDPALLDGGLQIVSLWARHVLGGQALPTSIGGLYLYRGGPVASPVRCFLRGRASGPRRVVADLSWVAEGGAPVAYLHDVEMHLPLVADFKTAQNGAA